MLVIFLNLHLSELQLHFNYLISLQSLILALIYFFQLVIKVNFIAIAISKTSIQIPKLPHNLAFVTQVKEVFITLKEAMLKFLSFLGKFHCI